jgi:hypothetical protein
MVDDKLLATRNSFQKNRSVTNDIVDVDKVTEKEDSAFIPAQTTPSLKVSASGKYKTIAQIDLSDNEDEVVPQFFHILGKEIQQKGTEWNHDLSRILSNYSNSSTDQTLARVLLQSLLFLPKKSSLLYWFEGFTNFLEEHFTKNDRSFEEDLIGRKSVPTLIICQPQFLYPESMAEEALENEYPELVEQIQKYAHLINPRNLVLVIVTYGAVVPWDRKLPFGWKRLFLQEFFIKEKSTGNETRSCRVHIVLLNSDEEELSQNLTDSDEIMKGLISLNFL